MPRSMEEANVLTRQQVQQIKELAVDPGAYASALIETIEELRELLADAYDEMHILSEGDDGTWSLFRRIEAVLK